VSVFGLFYTIYYYKKQIISLNSKIEEISVDFSKRISKERKDAISQSRSVLVGQGLEQLVPLTVDFGFLGNDSRFLGSPIDYIIFNGLSDEENDKIEIIFLEVKTGKARLSNREKLIKNAVLEKRVEWKELRIKEGLILETTGRDEQ